jgi:hypothetical protein
VDIVQTKGNLVKTLRIHTRQRRPVNEENP